MNQSRYFWIIVAMAFIATGLSFLDRQVLSILIIKIKQELTISDVQYGFINTGFLIGYAIMFTVSGILIDRYGSRYGLAVSVGLWSIATALHSVANTVLQFEAFRFLLGVGEGGAFPGAIKAVTDWVPKKRLALANGIPMCGESDQKTLIALFIMFRLGIGGSFAEFHPVDFNEGFVLVGHDGPHNIGIAQGKPVLRSLKKYHGKPGYGAGVEFNIKEGPITMLSINSTYDGKFKFVIAEGESVKGPIPPTGNTNTRGFFKPDIKTFLTRWIKEGPTHHFALGIGHHANTIGRIANYLNIESVIISREKS